jgi:hypothetical protein
VAGPGYADVVLSDPSLKNKFTLYRGKPLVRANNMLCYGDMRDKYIVFMMILTTKKTRARGPPILAGAARYGAGADLGHRRKQTRA